jgi:hypothetical protein
MYFGGLQLCLDMDVDGRNCQDAHAPSSIFGSNSDWLACVAADSFAANIMAQYGWPRGGSGGFAADRW